MTQEDKYNAALERARDLMTNQNPPAFDKDLISLVFPELKESEDERTRKALKQGFLEYEKSFTTFGGIKVEDIISWLEKQKPIDEKELKQGALKYVARQFMNWLEEKIIEDEMYLSNVECKAIEDAFLKRDWTSISRYMWERLEKQGKALPTPKWFMN